jgi:hypothetical protein
VSALNLAATAFSNADSHEKALPANNQAAFVAGTQKLVAGLQPWSARFSAKINSLNNNPTIGNAAKSTPACSSLHS